MISILRALRHLPALVAMHWGPILAYEHKATWACEFNGKPVRLPILAECPVTGRRLIQFPDGRLDFVAPRPRTSPE